MEKSSEGLSIVERDGFRNRFGKCRSFQQRMSKKRRGREGEKADNGGFAEKQVELFCEEDTLREKKYIDK